jgi:hypothetical protein
MMETLIFSSVITAAMFAFFRTGLEPATHGSASISGMMETGSRQASGVKSDRVINRSYRDDLDEEDPTCAVTIHVSRWVWGPALRIVK